MKGGERKGPVNLEGLRDLLQDGEINKETMVWNKGMGDQWAKVEDVTVLSGPLENTDDPEVKEDFRRKMEERRAKLAAEKSAGLKRNAVIAAVAVLVVGGAAAFVKSGPRRAWGVSSSDPICSLKKLEKKLIGEYQMEKTRLESYGHMGKPASKIFQYTGAKATPGDHVSGKGTVTVSTDDDYRVKAVVGVFPSPGMRGPLLNNRSAGSITMEGLWIAHGGEEKKTLLMQNEVLPGISGTGLSNVPNDAVCQVVESEKVRAIWTEHGPNTRHSIVYFEVR